MPRSSTFIVVAALLALSACKGGGSDTGSTSTDQPTSTAPAVVDENAATVTGSIKFAGTAPKRQKISMAADAYCKTAHTGDVFSEEVVVNPNKTLKNVYVYVKSGLGDQQFPAPSEPVVLDQEGCLYTPRVVAVQTGQTLQVSNSDSVLHNVNAQAKINPGFNLGQPVKGMKTPRTFSKPEVMIPVKCDVHPWMRGYIGVQSHPFAAVSNDEGSFTFENLPPGEYEIEAWHETYGTSTQKVTVGPKETKTVNFTFKGA